MGTRFDRDIEKGLYPDIIPESILREFSNKCDEYLIKFQNKTETGYSASKNFYNQIEVDINSL